MSMCKSFTRHAIKARDMFRRWKFKKFLKITKTQYGDKLEILCGEVFNTCMELILNDVVENGAIFRFPQHESYIRMAKIEGENLAKAIQGDYALAQVDFLASNFKAYEPVYERITKNGVFRKPFLLPNKLKDRIIELVNSGKTY